MSILSEEENLCRSPRFVEDNEHAYYLIRAGVWSLEDFEDYIREKEMYVEDIQEY